MEVIIRLSVIPESSRKENGYFHMGWQLSACPKNGTERLDIFNDKDAKELESLRKMTRSIYDLVKGYSPSGDANGSMETNRE